MDELISGELRDYVLREGMNPDTILSEGLTHEFFRRVVVDRNWVPLRNAAGDKVYVRELWPWHMRENIYAILNNN